MEPYERMVKHTIRNVMGRSTKIGLLVYHIYNYIYIHGKKTTGSLWFVKTRRIIKKTGLSRPGLPWAIPANQRYKGVCGIRSKLLSRWRGYMVGFWNSGNWASNGDLNLDLAPSGWCQRQFLKKAEPAAWWFKCNDSEASTKALDHEFAKFPTHESSQT